jgi:hypothetical protein
LLCVQCILRAMEFIYFFINFFAVKDSLFSIN